MICPKCESEYIDTVKVCPDCGSDLVSNEEYSGSLSNPEDYVIVYSVSEEYEAEMIKANLEGAEIPCLILAQKDSSFPGAGELSVIKILVRKEDAEDAKEIIDDIYNSDEEFETDEE